MYGFRHYGVRLRRSQRHGYVIARRLMKGAMVVAVAMVLFALYRAS